MRISSTVAAWPVSPMLRRTSFGCAQDVEAGHPARCRSSGTLSVVSIRTSVVLPAPLGPSRPRTVPVGDDEAHAVDGAGVPEVLDQVDGLDRRRSRSCAASSSRVPTVRGVLRRRHAARMRPPVDLRARDFRRWRAEQRPVARGARPPGQDQRHERPPRRTARAAGDLIDVAALVTAYYTVEPDPAEPAQQVAFGTSGHRGSSLRRRLQRGAHPRHHPGDLRVPGGAGLRRPAVHRPGHPRAVRAGLGHGARGAGRQRRHGARRRRRPVHAHARRSATRSCGANRGKTAGLADGIVVTPSHNPPRDGGFKYNPPHGGPADTDATGWIAGPRQRAAAGGPRAASAGCRSTRPGPPPRPTTSSAPTSTTCPTSLDLDAIRDAGVRIGADPLGGASVDYWAAIAERHGSTSPSSTRWSTRRGGS